MGNVFNPGSARYRRTVNVLTAAAATTMGGYTIFLDFGRQEHVLSGLQRMLYKRLDKAYELTAEELAVPPPPGNSYTRYDGSWVTAIFGGGEAAVPRGITPVAGVISKPVGPPEQGSSQEK